MMVTFSPCPEHSALAPRPRLCGGERMYVFEGILFKVMFELVKPEATSISQHPCFERVNLPAGVVRLQNTDWLIPEMRLLEDPHGHWLDVQTQVQVEGV